MITLFIAIVVVGVLVVSGEFIRQLHNFHPEIIRKFIHITVATFAASWPFFMSWNNVELMSLLLFAGIVVSKRLYFFKSIHSVKRLTWGEIFFPVSIGMAALLSGNKWVFVAAMLHLGLADGLAAIIGTLFGHKHIYKVFGHKKSRAGSITFYICSFFIILFSVVLNGPHDGLSTLVWLPLVATGLESIGIAGTDNLLVPMLIVLTV
jgi:phytol kinase